MKTTQGGSKCAVQMSARLTDAEALTLYSELSIHELGRRAFARCAELHPEPYRTYVVDRNVNYANVCTARCIFCNFYRKPGSDEAYILSYEQIGQKIEELLDIGGTQILMQGGLVPGEHDPTGQQCDPVGCEITRRRRNVSNNRNPAKDHFPSLQGWR